MTRAEVIRKFAKRCGVPDSEAKVFFEMLLGIISKKLPAGDKLIIDNIGVLHLRKAKLRNYNQGNVTENGFTIKNVITFISEEMNDELLFNIPLFEEDDLFKSPDYHFSLSIGKPVIPLKGSRSSEFIIPPGGQELRHLLYSKAERLITESEITKENKGDEQYITSSVKPGQTGNKPLDAKKLFTPEDVSKQIEEDSLLDLDKTPSSPSIDQKVKKDEGTGKAADPQIPDKIISEPLDQKSKFERVRTVKKNLPEETTGKNPELVKPLSSLNSGYAPVKRVSDFIPEEDVSNVKQAQHKGVKKGRQRIQENEDTIKEKSYRGRRSRALIIVLFAILLLSALISLLYYSPFSGFNDKPELLQVTNTPVVPHITERKFDIPVTYPYDKSINTADFNFDPISIIYTEQETTDKAQIIESKVQEGGTQQNPDNNTEENFSNNIPRLEPVKVKENIYRYNDIFMVQISSWKSKSKAESEVIKFKNNGYNAFLEQAPLSGKGVYYRVRVGDFTSQQIAEEFLKKNI